VSFRLVVSSVAAICAESWGVQDSRSPRAPSNSILLTFLPPLPQSLPYTAVGGGSTARCKTFRHNLYSSTSKQLYEIYIDVILYRNQSCSACQSSHNTDTSQCRPCSNTAVKMGVRVNLDPPTARKWGSGPPQDRRH